MVNETDGKNPTDKPAKLPYKKPRLVELGTVRDLTAATGTRGSLDGVMKDRTSL